MGLPRIDVHRVLIALFLMVSPLVGTLNAQTLRVASVNFWSGVDYQGVISVGEYETEHVRSLRLQALVHEMRHLKPDVIALQECNEVFHVVPELADSLGYDYFYQRSNSGIKIWRIGIPWNLNEGIAVLARRDLHLEFVDVWYLSESFGAAGNSLSFHFDDQNLALATRVIVAGRNVYVVNAHLSSGVPDLEASRGVARFLLKFRGLPEADTSGVFERLHSNAVMRQRETERIAEHIQERFSGSPVVLLGDFNATPVSPEIDSLVDGGFVDALDAAGIGDSVTWDPEGNPNIRFSLSPVDEDGDTLGLVHLLSTRYDRFPRRIDYVFLGPGFVPADVVGAHVILRNPVNGVYASDHYGVMADISCSRILNSLPPEGNIPSPEPGVDVLPILTYDTDVGFGYGGKGFLLNYLGWSESFDLVAFNSTKGERWYRFVFSVPDFELRQGKPYGLSFDFTVDYDTYLKNNFYGLGGNTPAERRETYKKEPLEISGLFSRGFSREFVGQVGLKFKTVRNLGYADTSAFALTLPSINHRRSSALTLFASIRYDSRDSYINPSRGNVAQLDLELGSSTVLSDYDVAATTISLQMYRTLFYPRTVFAARLLSQVATGSDLPVHSYVSFGGNKTLRGYPQDRFLGQAGLLVNLELRFPIIWRFDGLFFLDSGKLWQRLSEVQLARGWWRSSPGIGLRFDMDTFIVRADLGFSTEGTGFYFNFGHVF